jgi:hypothetical protein
MKFEQRILLLRRILDAAEEAEQTTGAIKNRLKIGFSKTCFKHSLMSIKDMK